MNPSIKILCKTVELVNNLFPSHHFVIVNGFCSSNYRVVDISCDCRTNIIDLYVIREFKRFNPSFEVVKLPTDVVSFYGVSDVYYLSLNFDVI